MKTILIFGATGTIGAYASLYLREKGYNIIAIGRRNSDGGFFEDYGIEYYSINIIKKEEFSKLKNIKVDVILHCAGIMPSTMEGYQPEQYIDSVLTGTLNILDYARGIGVEKIIFTQSRADSNYLMGIQKPIPSDIEKKFPLKGDHSIYSICKNAAVDLIEHYYHEYGIKRFILRLPTIYAYHPDSFFYVDGQRKRIAYRQIMKQAVNGEQIEIWGDPGKEKEITYIKDLCQIFEHSITSELEGGVYNVGRGIGVTLEEQIKGIVEVFCTENKKSDIIYRPDKPDARQFIHDISKTKKDLGYVPQFDYLNLLLDFKKEMEENRFKKLWGIESQYE